MDIESHHSKRHCEVGGTIIVPHKSYVRYLTVSHGYCKTRRICQVDLELPKSKIKNIIHASIFVVDRRDDPAS